MSSIPILCSNPACKIAEGGRCVEGLDPDKCPNFGHPIKTDTAEMAGIESGVGGSELSLLPSSVLDAASATRHLALRISRVVAVIGTFNAGKTSLIASIYDAFQRNPVAGVSFAGSSTLQSFEVACHDTRSASRRAEAEMFRTPRGDARFYHIDLFETTTSELIGVLIADRAGEEYLMVSADVSHAKPLFEVRRADTVTILVDGARLSSSVERHTVRAEIEGIVQGLVDSEVLKRKPRLAIALTKNDEVTASARPDRVEADFNRLVQSIETKFAQHFYDIEAFKTTACPKKPNAVRGQGVKDLLAFWLRPPFVSPVQAAVPQASRDFGRLRQANK